MDFYAHSAKREDHADWQTLKDHLTSVGELAARSACIFGAADLACVQGLLHDLGKYTIKFQDRLHGGKRVDHATWGAIVAVEVYGKELGTLLGYGIAGHHAGLANGKVGSARTSLLDRMKSRLPELLSDWKQEISLPNRLQWPPVGFRVDNERGMFQLALLARMLFSCLVDADYVDTDEFYRRVEKLPPRFSGTEHITLPQLRDRLNNKLDAFSPDSPVKIIRAEILSHVKQNASNNPGLFSLTVPTGGGKTLTSMAFALDHAIVHGMRRVIYVIPFTSIIEQNVQVFRDAFGDLRDAVLEHHSGFDDAGMEREAKQKRDVAMENWDAPVVVTTAVQFFESLFADRPSRCRKLHNIAGSVVILDEAQTLPLKFLRPCVTLIDELATNYKISIVLCTATQPALRLEDGFVGGLRNVRELSPTPEKLYDTLRRVTVRHVGILDDVALTEQMRQREQVLCIVNNRRHARAIFESLSDSPGALHLTTLMFPNHRRDVLREARRRLEAHEPCRLVSTSLIEAGVDIDMPTVLRAEAGLDSIAQAAGRCNREGRRSREESELLVFATGNEDWKPPQELKQYAQVFREILHQYGDDLLAPVAIKAYFKHLYWQKAEKGLDTAALLDLLRKKSSFDSLPFETLAAELKFIDSATKPIIIPFDAVTKQRLKHVEDVLDAMTYAPSMARSLQPYLVQVPHKAYDALMSVGAIQAVAPEQYGDQFMQLVNSALYDSNVGLNWDNPTFIESEKTIW